MSEEADQSPPPRRRLKRLLISFFFDLIIVLLVARLFEVFTSSEVYDAVVDFQAGLYSALNDLNPWHMIQIYWGVLAKWAADFGHNWQATSFGGKLVGSLALLFLWPLIPVGMLLVTVGLFYNDPNHLVGWVLAPLLGLVGFGTLLIWSKEGQHRNPIKISVFLLLLPILIAVLATFLKFGMLLCWIFFGWLGGELSKLSFIFAIFLPGIGWATGKYTEHTLTEVVLKCLKRVFRF